MQAEWSGLDRYYTAALQVEDSALNSALSANAAAGLPAQDVSPLQGRGGCWRSAPWAATAPSGWRGRCRPTAGW
ncbi:hypothetical protein [Chromobacterium haemolyticum]|uniref:hypothetical protein n=1 Tax=Chromobacterium haemolyticum TaxID=394935 RepID=UPI0018DDA99E|nr:hypothetical protein [Chromobacterium haemolyticum]